MAIHRVGAANQLQAVKKVPRIRVAKHTHPLNQSTLHWVSGRAVCSELH